jgi:hypothetical protein
VHALEQVVSQDSASVETGSSLHCSWHLSLQLCAWQALQAPGFVSSEQRPERLLLQSDWHSPMQLGGSSAATSCSQSVVQLELQLVSQELLALAEHVVSQSV